jgi:hypothetical protein
MPGIKKHRITDTMTAFTKYMFGIHLSMST